MTDSQFIFCEGCGARLAPQDRSCPKCGHPAPGILSAASAASDLAAGKTASFPRLSQELIESAIPVPGGDGAHAPLESLDAFAADYASDETGVLDADALARAQQAQDQARARSSHRSAVPPVTGDAPVYPNVPAAEDDFGPRRKRGRWIAAAFAALVVVGGAWFVAADPMNVMDDFYAQIDRSAADMFPSRQASEEDAAQEGDGAQDGTDAQDDSALNDATLSDDAVFTRLSALWDTIYNLPDQLGPVIDAYNGYYIANDRTLREENAQVAYDLRDAIQAIIDELDGMQLAEGSVYIEDVAHLRQLATWMYNRVDVLCRSWDISLGLPDGERPRDHQDEILKPLRDVEKVDGKAVDVIEYESNILDWKPVEK